MMILIAVATIIAALSGLTAAILVAVLLRQRREKVDFAPLLARMDVLDRAHERLERTVRDDLATQRAASSEGERHLREELAASDKLLREEINTRMHEGFGHTFTQLLALRKTQDEKFDIIAGRFAKMTEVNEAKLDAIRTTVTERLETLQLENARKLDEMRQVVDEKLQGTLERRIGESFKLVSDNLERVQRGLGEMQTLAAGVGDLKKVLSNVKTRGTWGEVQLGSLLEQILSPAQYEANVCTKGEGLERVEFAIKLPSKMDDDGILWLPIDAKFPQEDYLRLVEAQDAANVDEADAAAKALEARIRDCAHDISTKYVSPPQTTDFGIMFLPSEGLYAEVIRRTGLVERLQREMRVVVAGPTTLAAILNTFQMGFRTLAIQKQSSEVWQVLGQVKTEFTKFGGVLDKVRKKLTEASNVVDTAGVRTRAIEKTLRSVEAMPVSANLIGALPALSAELGSEADDDIIEVGAEPT
ncbi:MAG TPA: DNA recombination protein RmuC [Gemmatimonadaceae bacterium]|jgi:DNA recombination protein RmuC